jgi:hypothetical protein
MTGGCFLYGDKVLAVEGSGGDANLIGHVQPSVSVRRPVIVSPGGTNYLYDSPNIDTQPGATVTLCPKVDGTFRWPTGTALAGQAIDPQPPVKGGQVWHTIFPDGATLGTSQHIRYYGASSILTALGSSRVYLLPAGGFDSSFEFSVAANGGFGPFTGVSGPATERWLPIHRSVTTTPGWVPTYTWVSGGTQRKASFFICLDVFNQGLCPSYSMDFGATGAHEKLSVTGLACGTQWTVAITTQVPMDSWDQWSMGLVTTSCPLFTVRGNATNYVEFSLIKGASATATGTLRAAVTSGGSSVGNLDITGVWANKGSIISVVLTQTATQLQLSALVAGSPVGVATNLTATMAVNPTEVRFSNQDQTDVTPLIVHSVAVEPSVTTNAAARAALLQGRTLFLPESSGSGGTLAGNMLELPSLALRGL